MKEREAARDSYPIERDGFEEVKVMKNRLLCEACMPQGMWCQPRAMSGSVALPQPQFMSMALVTNEGCEDAWAGLPM